MIPTHQYPCSENGQYENPHNGQLCKHSSQAQVVSGLCTKLGEMIYFTKFYVITDNILTILLNGKSLFELY